MGDELTRIRAFEKHGNAHLKAADRALKQIQIANAPMLKYFDAVDLWNKAGKCFGIATEWEDAAHAYSKAADCMANIGKPHEAAVFSLKSAEMMRRIDPAEAIDSYHNAVSMYCEIGRFYSAANITVGIAELFEQDRNNADALEHYRQASDYYNGENYIAQSCICLLKVAYHAALLSRFEYATETYTKVAKVYIHDNLLRLNLHEIFLKGGICQIAAGGRIKDGLLAHKVLKEYLMIWEDLDYSFKTSREHLFLTNLLLIIPKADLDIFVDHIYNFDNVYGLDSWCLRLLNRVKEDIEEEVNRAFEEKKQKESEAKHLEDIKAGLVSEFA
jgi:alpha-soluble NSF attachment protein